MQETTETSTSGRAGADLPPASGRGEGPAGWLRSLGRALPGFGIPFLVLLYLALDAGGYDILVRSQLGIVAWWVVLLGLAFGYLPVATVTRSGWIVGLTMLLLLAWTAIGALLWTESTERGLIEASRILALLGFLALFLLFQGRQGLRRSVTALGATVGVIAAIALLERLEPDLLPFLKGDPIPENYPGARLRFPLEYWNGLAAMLAMGLPALSWIGSEGRTRLGRAVASGVIPLVGLALYMTFSRGGILEVLVATAVLLALFPRRLWLLTVTVAPAAAFVLLVRELNARQELLDFLPGEATAEQGGEMFWIVIAVAVTTGLVRLALDVGFQAGRIKVPRASARLTNLIGALAAGAVVLLLLAGIGSGFLGERWDEFRQPETSGNVSQRLGSVSSSERYFLYDAAIAAGQTEPATGIGPGTFEYWWSREGEGRQFVRDAHSLYLEAFAELGVPGLLLVLALVFAPISIGIRLLLRHGPGESRSLLAAAVASMVAFVVAAGIDWAWELTVLPAAFLLLAAAVAGPSARTGVIRDPGKPAGSWGRSPRWIGAAFALVSIAALALPLAGTQLVRDSQAEVRSGRLDGALARAERGVALQPWSASALVQEAQVLELYGQYGLAAESAREATRKEPGNWRNWYVLASILDAVDPAGAAEARARAGDLRARVGGSLP